MKYKKKKPFWLPSISAEYIFEFPWSCPGRQAANIEPWTTTAVIMTRHFICNKSPHPPFNNVSTTPTHISLEWQQLLQLHTVLKLRKPHKNIRNFYSKKVRWNILVIIIQTQSTKIFITKSTKININNPWIRFLWILELLDLVSHD